jgi:thymidylate kinase
VIIFDRYLYDELANLPLRSRLTRSYVHLVLKFVPQPDVAYLVDADPLQARERKPEYPLEFVQRNRAAYLTLNEMTAAMTLITARTTAEVEGDVLREILKKLSPPQREAVSARCSKNGAGAESDGQSLPFQECQRVSGL